MTQTAVAIVFLVHNAIARIRVGVKQMNDRPRPTAESRSIRVPLRQIEDKFGRGNDDDAADEIIYALRRASAQPGQFRYRINYDLSHSNPWFHAMIFEVEGVPDHEYGKFIELLAGIGLAHSND